MKRSLIAVVIAVLAAVTWGQNVPRGAGGPIYPLRYGRVRYCPLADLAADRLRPACDLLVDRRIAEAAPAFAKATKADPSDLVAFVGNAQCDPAGRDAAIRQLTGDTSDRARQFKLAVLLFYRWASQPSILPYDDLQRAETLAQAAWRESHSVIAGLLLLEINQIRNPIPHAGEREIRNTMIRDLAGPEAYRRFVEAGKSGWGGDPPPPSATVAANRRPLQGVLKDLWSDLNRRYRYGKQVNGKTVWGDWTKISPENRREIKYIERWIEALKAAS